MPLRSTFSHVNRMNFKGACNYDKKIPVPLPAKTSTVPPLYWSTPNYYYRNLSDNHPLETIYSLLFYFPYKATADCLCRKTARSLSKEMKFYHGNRADIGSSFACLRGRTCFGSLCCARRCHQDVGFDMRQREFGLTESNLEVTELLPCVCNRSQNNIIATHESFHNFSREPK